MKFGTTPLQKRNKLTLWAIGLLFTFINGYLLTKGIAYFAFIPIALLGLILVFISPEKALVGLSFLAPLSIEVREIMPDLGFSIILPTEPILALLLISLLLLQLTPNRLPHEITKHTVSIAIYAFIGWLLLDTFKSELPLVSLKYTLVRCWFFAAFYFFAVHLFRKKNRIEHFFWAYILGLFIVALLALSKQAESGLFNKSAATSAACPFFNDHTSFAAAIALAIPMLIIFLIKAKSIIRKATIGALLLFFIIALILSYTRAAWLSLIFAGGVFVLIQFRIKLRTILIAAGIMVATFFFFQEEITNTISRTKAISSTNLLEHLQSITNVSSDASNAERVNRWHSAIELFKERPVMGWGPGTYIFVYGDFQIAKDRTVISTNRGSGGNAHSEYLGLMAESGILGVLLYILILGIVYHKGIRYYQTSTDREMRLLVMAALLGISTYVMHSSLNNFLDVDEIAAPFWAFAAVIVAADLSRKQEKTVL